MTHLDPVCGMTIEEEEAAGSYEHGGVKYFFCHPSCLERFRENPSAFLTADETAVPAAGTMFTCPMDPDVRQSVPGPCPKCGMALEPDLATAPLTKTEYTCPMHPEIVVDRPGSCPICGMALEPRTVTLEDAPNPELVDMARRFRLAATIGAPVFVLTMFDMVRGGGMAQGPLVNWVGLVLSTPVVFWAGWPFFDRAWASIVNRSPNMFTLIALGVGAAYSYSAVGTIAPGLFPGPYGCMAP